VVEEEEKEKESEREIIRGGVLEWSGREVEVEGEVVVVDVVDVVDVRRSPPGEGVVVGDPDAVICGKEDDDEDVVVVVVVVVLRL